MSLHVPQERPWMTVYPSSMPHDFDIPETSLYSILDTTAEKYPEHIAIIFENQQISYFQLKNMVDRLAAAWKQRGAAKGERLGLMVSNDPLYVVSYYAALKLGMMIVQINPHYTARELLEIFNDASVNYLVTEPECLEKVTGIKDYSFKEIFVTANGTGYPGLPELIQNAVPLEDTYSIQAVTDIAVIQYTGGTTGKKKGAMLTHYNLVANVMQSKALYGKRMLEGAETILTATPLYHVYGMTSGMNLSIYIGATNLLVAKFEVEKVLQQIQMYKPTIFPGVPKMYHAFAHYHDIESYNLTCFKMCTSGSAPLPIEIMKKFERLTGVTVGEGYGLSETSPTTHRNPPDGVSKIGSIGIPLPKTDCRIVDDNGEDVPEKAVGELLIRGPQVMLGYWNKPEETKNALKDGWFYTGDLAMMDEEGYFYIVGRKKEMILVGGFNVYPQEVEGVLYEHPAVLEAAVVGIPDREIGEVVTAFIVPKPDCDIDFDELRDHCQRHLTRYKVPKVFEIRDALPRNSVGKLLKRILVEESTKKTKA